MTIDVMIRVVGTLTTKVVVIRIVMIHVEIRIVIRIVMMHVEIRIVMIHDEQGAEMTRKGKNLVTSKTETLPMILQDHLRSLNLKIVIMIIKKLQHKFQTIIIRILHKNLLLIMITIIIMIMFHLLLKLKQKMHHLLTRTRRKNSLYQIMERLIMTNLPQKSNTYFSSEPLFPFGWKKVIYFFFAIVRHHQFDDDAACRVYLFFFSQPYSLSSPILYLLFVVP
mmetsp:Transcript_13472/g.16275  ORF Transcript_13472/g.16275 Transcript_13472/m.16275 type:complete len:223 (+) Transcript_13472:291-959(+)